MTPWKYPVKASASYFIFSFGIYLWCFSFELFNILLLFLRWNLTRGAFLLNCSSTVLFNFLFKSVFYQFISKERMKNFSVIILLVSPFSTLMLKFKRACVPWGLLPSVLQTPRLFYCRFFMVLNVFFPSENLEKIS